MKIYSKILFTILPLVFIFMVSTVGTTYYFSRSALLDLGETWLDTRLSMAVDIVKDQQKMLHAYGLESISAGIAKAKLDAEAQIKDIGVGEMGYIFAVDQNGTIIFHPNKYLKDTDISQEDWFKQITDQSGRLVIDLDGIPSLARFEHFTPWNWYILAVDPMQEVYGVSESMLPYLYSLGALGTIIISLALMFMTRRIIRPLNELVQGAENIGKGELDTRIAIHSRDEFGHLAKEFNQMAFRLQETLATLQYREEHFRALIENANDLIWILDRKGRFRYLSPSTQRILGYPREDLLGQNAFDFVHPKDREDLFQRFELRAKSLITAQPTSHRFRHKDGYWCVLESISKNLTDHPAIKGMVINSRNITKRQKAEQALKQSHQELENRVKERTSELLRVNKTLSNEILIRKGKEKELERANTAKNQFLANISHEIKTPLNSVIGFSELLTTMITEKQQASYLHTITMAGKNLLELINDILDLSKMEAGKLEINANPVSLATLLDEVRHLFHIKLKEKDLTLHINLPSQLPPALIMDEMHLRQIIVNLVDNAIKFTEKGHISIEAGILPSPKNPETRVDLSITVEDSGPGIPVDKQHLVFESFEQESAGTSKKFGGTGLGLAICKQLTTLMGGKISIAGSPGKGSRFTIDLPEVTISQEGIPARSGGEQNLNNTRFSRQTILVVDDQKPIRFMLRETLEKINLEVIEATDGREAVEMAVQQLPKAILMDKKMPEMDGSTATRKLKANPATRNIPICLMTASMNISAREELDGYDAMLTKPIIIDNLMKVLIDFLPGQSIAAKGTALPEPIIRLEKMDIDLLDPAIRERLTADIVPWLPELREGMKISDIQEFAKRLQSLGDAFSSREFQEFGEELVSKRLQSLGDAFSSREFQEFGEELYGQTQTFDIEKINQSLKQLSQTLSKLDIS